MTAKDPLPSPPDGMTHGQHFSKLLKENMKDPAPIDYEKEAYKKMAKFKRELLDKDPAPSFGCPDCGERFDFMEEYEMHQCKGYEDPSPSVFEHELVKKLAKDPLIRSVSKEQELKPIKRRGKTYAVIKHLAGINGDRIHYFEDATTACNFYDKQEDAELILFETLLHKGYFR